MSELRSARGRRTSVAMYLCKALVDSVQSGGFYNSEFIMGGSEAMDVIWIKDLVTGEVIQIAVTTESGT